MLLIIKNLWNYSDISMCEVAHSCAMVDDVTEMTEKSP